MNHSCLALCWLAFTVTACGGAVEHGNLGEHSDSGAHTSPEAAGVQEPSCVETASKETAPGPCAAQNRECDSSPHACGVCSADKSCFENRCYSPVGSPETPAPYDLMRNLAQDPEGLSCQMSRDGVLESVAAAIWEAGAPAIVMDVYQSCGDDMVKAATVTLPGSSFPAYDGIHGEMRATTFHLNPPIRVRKGDRVDVLFHSTGPWETGAVSGIVMNPVTPDCQFLPSEGAPGLPDVDYWNWDYVARLFVH